ncbi:MAG: hypothetical protein HFJ41_07020, partial [Clostridia bacterium]|nr:hypothetical protein [Clostridia bacterium]
LEEAGIEVNGDIVTVDNYNFTIDRENLKILTENGESNIKVTKEVKRYLGKNANGKYEAQILVTIESDKELKNIIIENPDGTTLKLETKNTKIAKDMTVEFNEEYKVIITEKEGKATTRTIIEKSQETIRTAEELVEFRDKVNSGLTYEGKTIKLENNIDLSRVCGENINGKQINWKPIGNVNRPYKGIFDGNNNTISNIYIKEETSYVGLFGNIDKAEIKNITIDNSIIEVKNSCGIIAGVSNNSILQNIHTTKNNIIIATTPSTYGIYVGGICGNTVESTILNASNSATVIGNGWYVGGIVGIAFNNTTISKSYNAGNIKGYQNLLNIQSIGGILGSNCENVEINNCYNIGKIEGYGRVAGICGNVHELPMLTITNCYNNGIIIAATDLGEIVGCDMTSNRKINNCYTKSQSITALQLGNDYMDDEKSEEGLWKYNSGYPILRWQFKENI